MGGGGGENDLHADHLVMWAADRRRLNRTRGLKTCHPNTPLPIPRELHPLSGERVKGGIKM